MSAGTVYVGVPGDVDGNRIVNMLDLYNIALDFGVVAGQPEYVANYDVDGNGIINIQTSTSQQYTSGKQTLDSCRTTIGLDPVCVWVRSGPPITAFDC